MIVFSKLGAFIFGNMPQAAHNSSHDATLAYFIIGAIFFLVYLISSILLSVGASKGSYITLYFI